MPTNGHVVGFENTMMHDLDNSIDSGICASHRADGRLRRSVLNKLAGIIHPSYEFTYTISAVLQSQTHIINSHIQLVLSSNRKPIL